MEGSSLSPAVTRMIALTASLASFQESSGLLKDLAGVRPNSKQAERTAEALGRKIAQDERESVEPAGEDRIAPAMRLGVDGAGIPMRKPEVQGRKGKQADGSAKTVKVRIRLRGGFRLRL
jgi:hypothetical protein